MADADIHAALERIRSEFGAFGVSGADFSRLLKLAEGVTGLADRWRRQSTTGYDASAEHASALRTVLEESLLGEEDGGG
jgi:hypothetical protein